jgi:hypothetical protein
MTEYRRARIPAATWFFTVNLAERKGNRLLVEEIGALRSAFAWFKQPTLFVSTPRLSYRSICIVSGHCYRQIPIFPHVGI